MSLHWYDHRNRPKYIIDGGYFPSEEGMVVGIGNNDLAPDVISPKELVKKIMGTKIPPSKIIEVPLTEQEVLDLITLWTTERSVVVEQKDIDDAKIELAAIKEEPEIIK